MPNVFKQFGEKATDSFSRMMTQTRLTMALTYVAILAVLLMASGGISRYVFTERLRLRFESSEQTEVMVGQRARSPVPNRRMIQADFQETVLFVNGFLLVLAGVLSYGLAGITLRPIREAYQRQRQFLSDASHELRTPLAILRADLENQRLRATSDVNRASIDSHLEEVLRMAQIVEDLLVLSQFHEQGEDLPEKESVDLSMLLPSTIERLKRLAARQGITLSFVHEQTQEGRTVVLGHARLLAQAFMNILKNAITYNTRGGSVTVRLHQNRSQVWVEIEDTGVGMAPEDVAHAFDRFYRAEKSRSRGTGGSGLGLSITQAIVRRHQGTIEIESVLGAGTRVNVTFPIHSAS